MDVLTPEETHLVLILRTLFEHHKRAVLAFAYGLADLPETHLDHIKPQSTPQPTKH